MPGQAPFGDKHSPASGQSNWTHSRLHWAGDGGEPATWNTSQTSGVPHSIPHLWSWDHCVINGSVRVKGFSSCSWVRMPFKSDRSDPMSLSSLGTSYVTDPFSAEAEALSQGRLCWSWQPWRRPQWHLPRAFSDRRLCGIRWQTTRDFNIRLVSYFPFLYSQISFSLPSDPNISANRNYQLKHQSPYTEGLISAICCAKHCALHIFCINQSPPPPDCSVMQLNYSYALDCYIQFLPLANRQLHICLESALFPPFPLPSTRPSIPEKSKNRYSVCSVTCLNIHICFLSEQWPTQKDVRAQGSTLYTVQVCSSDATWEIRIPLLHWTLTCIMNVADIYRFCVKPAAAEPTSPCPWSVWLQRCLHSLLPTGAWVGRAGLRSPPCKRGGSDGEHTSTGPYFSQVITRLWRPSNPKTHLLLLNLFYL